jgi:heptosyltransferase-2
MNAVPVRRSAVAMLGTYARLTGIAAGKTERRVRRLLVTSTGGLGDGVLVGSLIQHLRARTPDLEVGVLARFGARAALTALPNVHAHDYELQDGRMRSWHALSRELREARYKAALATDHASLNTAAILCLARIERRVGFASLGNCPQARLYTDVVRLNESESQWQSLLCLARLIDPELSPSLDVLPLPIATDVDAAAERWWNQRVGSGGGPAVALHLGSGAQTYKRWPVSRFVLLAEQIKTAAPRAVMLLTGQADEQELITEFTRNYTGRALEILSMRSVAEAAAILRRCDLLISNDGGVMHLGAAMGVPTVGLFGPASPQQWAPRGPHATFVQGSELPCRPCIRSYRGAPPARCTNPVLSQCMMEISIDDAIAAARRVAKSWLR